MVASHEIATLYVSIVPETSKVAPGLKKEFSQIEKSGKGVGSRLGDAIGTGVKRAAQGAGLAAGAILGTALTKGLGRLAAIDTAEAKLTGLGHSASSVAGIMDDALASVKGTAFGLGEAGAAAASAVASGVKPGQDLQRTLKLMGDAAAIAGTDLNSMASIFNKVAASGKIQGDVLAQLGDAGIPIVQLLSEELGVAADQVYKLAADGKIGFDQFQAAIESGMGGAALAVGDTFVGSMDNASAALGRLGAEALKPFFGGAITGVKTFTSVVDGLTSKVGPLAQELYDRLAPAAKTAGEFVEDKLVPGIRTVGEYAAAGMPTIQNFVSSLTSMIGPAMTIGEALMDVAASLGVSSWEALLTVLDITAGLMTSVVVPGLNVVAGVLDESSLAALAFGTALVGLTKGKAVLDGLQRSGAWMEKRAGTMADFGRAAKETAVNMQSFSRAHPEVTRLGAATKALGDNGYTGFAKITAGADSARQRVVAFGDAHRLAAAQAQAQALASTNAFNTIDRMGAQAWHGTVAAASSATQGIATSLGGLKGAGQAAFDGIKSAGSGLMSMMGGPFGVAMAGAAVSVGLITTAYGEAKRSAENMAHAASEAVKAQKELSREVAGTTGEIGEEGMAAATKLATARLKEFHESSAKARGVQGFFRDLALATGLTTRAFQENQMAARENEAAYNVLRDTAAGMGMTMDDVATEAVEGSPKYHQLRQALEDLGYNGEEATRMLEQMRAEQQRLVDQARRVSPASAEMSDAIEDIANKAGTAESRIDNFWRAIQRLRGQAPDMAESGRALGDEIDNLAQKLNVAEGETSEFAGAVLNANGTFDSLGGASSRAASAAVDELAKRMRDAVASGHDAQTIYDMARPSLDALGAAAGLSAEEVDRMAYAMQMTPKDLQIFARVESDAALGDIIHLQEKIDAMGTGLIGREITIEGGDDAINKLREIGVEFTIIDGEEGQIRIDAIDDDARRKLAGVIEEAGKLDSRPPARVAVESDIAGAQAALDDIGRQLGNVDASSASPTVGLSRDEFDGAVMGADVALTYLDDRFAVAGAGLDTEALDVSAWGAQTTLTGIDDRHAMASSDLDNVLLDANAGTAHTTLSVLDGERPTPIADLNNDGVRTGVDRATEWIRNFIREFANKVVNMTVNVAGFVRTVFSGGDGAANGGTIGALARGGSIDLVRGGSLPTAGPGTNVTDGFLGVDRGGMPIVRVDAGEEVINRKQAQKHRRLLKAINRGDPRIDDLPGFETGGSIGSREGLDRALREAQSSHDAGASYVWGGHSRTGSDCSGFVSRVAWTAQGVDPDSVGRMGNTNTMMAGQWPGFRRGRFGPFIVGVNSEHMAATIDGIPVESGGDVGGPSVGEGDGASDPQFTEHWSMDHAAFSPPYSNAPVESSGVIYDGGGASTAPSVSGGNDRVVPLEDSTAQKVERASQDENSIFYGTGSDSWSDLGGNLAKTAVSGQLSSLLKVLGIPDEMPPLVQAGKTWMQKVKDDASARDIEKGDEAVAEQAERELDGVAPFDRGGIAQGKGVLKKDVAEPERVLDPSQTRAFDELVAEITKSGVTSAVSAGAGAMEAYVPGIGAVAGPAGDAAGWYAGEVAKNVMATATTFAQDITGIGGAVMGGMVPITTPQVTAPAPVMPVMGNGGGEIHFHVADMHEAMHKARQIQAREARGLVGTRR